MEKGQTQTIQRKLCFFFLHLIFLIVVGGVGTDPGLLFQCGVELTFKQQLDLCK